MQYSNQQYMEQSVNTMTKGEILVLLYNEVIKCLTKAKMSGDKNNYEIFGKELNKAREIIDYLVLTLDRRYPVSAELYKMYDFINYEIARSKAGRKMEVIDEILPFVVELRDTWQEADRLSKGTVAYGQ